MKEPACVLAEVDMQILPVLAKNISNIKIGGVSCIRTGMKK
jgi:hypothetical protein